MSSRSSTGSVGIWSGVAAMDDRLRDHLLRRMDVFVSAVLTDLHAQLKPFYMSWLKRRERL